MMRDVVSDTGPLISFERIPGGFAIMRRIVRIVIIPPQVLEELQSGFPLGADYLTRHGIGDFIRVEPAPPPPPAVLTLDTGERYAISLAVARNLPLLVEDRKARLIADRLGLKSTGALGMILAACETGRLSTMEAKACIEALHQSGRISGHLQDMALARVTGH
jgi:predicted nucleic acid-binding protein